MIFELCRIKDLYQHFGDGYCLAMPLHEKQLDDLLEYLSAQNAEWRFYAVFSDGHWFHGIHIVFSKKKSDEIEPVIRQACLMLGLKSYWVLEGFTRAEISIDDDIISFVDFGD